jgi:putative ABC transport system permease protein
VSYGLTFSAALQGVAVGLLVSLLFSLVPLLEVRRVKPLLLLRSLDTQGAPAGLATAKRRFPAFLVPAWVSRADYVQIGAAFFVSAALVAVAAWQAGSLRVALVVCGAFAGISLILHGAGALVVRAARPLAAAPYFPLRHAVVSLRRPGNQTRVILLAVGLGTFFVLGVKALQANLLSQFSVQLQRGGADMFLIDIQQDQLDGVREFFKAAGLAEPRLIPVLRARVTGVRGRDLNLDSYADVRGRGGLGREYVITYRDRLEPNETLLEGKFWSGQPALPDTAKELEVSIEKNIRDRSRVRVGDLMRFDVLGRVIEARVTSVREVEWGDARNGGFMFVFRPGPLGRAPHTYIATLRAPEDPTARARFQRDLIAKYPNVSAIDVREVLASIQGVVDNVTFAISIVGTVALASGALILIGAVAMTKFQRVYEAAILRTLGASTRLLGTMLALEYSALGLIAGLIGAAGISCPELGGVPFRVRHRLGTRARPPDRRRPRHHRTGRDHRRRRQRRRAQEEAVGDAQGRVTPSHCQNCQHCQDCQNSKCSGHVRRHRAAAQMPSLSLVCVSESILADLRACPSLLNFGNVGNVGNFGNEGPSEARH